MCSRGSMNKYPRITHPGDEISKSKVVHYILHMDNFFFSNIISGLPFTVIHGVRYITQTTN